MDLQLNGKKALVTGGTRGIGRAIAETLTDEGCDVAICARNAEMVAEAVEAFTSKGVSAFGKSIDVSDGDALKSWVEASAAALGGIDILVPNVTGSTAPGEEGWRSHFDHDLLGTVRMVEAAMPHLSDSDSGSIIMISSSAALEKFVAAGPYNAIKAALLNYSGALAQDLAPKNIRVNIISPGPIFIEGGSWHHIKRNMAPFYEATLAEIPLGRMGTGAEVAAQVALLASPRAGFTTGTNVVIDGGITKRIQY